MISSSYFRKCKSPTSSFRKLLTVRLFVCHKLWEIAQFVVSRKQLGFDMWEESSGNVSSVLFFSNNGIALIRVSLLFLLKTKTYFSHLWHSWISVFSQLKPQTTAEMKLNAKSQVISAPTIMANTEFILTYIFSAYILHKVIAFCLNAWVNILYCIISVYILYCSNFHCSFNQ